MTNSNVRFERKYGKKQIPIPVKLNYFKSKLNPEKKKIAYWQAIQTEEHKNVILLHGFTRNSTKLARRAQIYWKNGFNVYLIDNLGHGKSSSILFPSGYRYSIEVSHFIKKNEIEDPIIHGVSMGGIATAFLAQKNSEICKAIVCEAIPLNFENLYAELLSYIKIPSFLFPWLKLVSYKIAWKQFEGLDIKYDIRQISCPFMLIHSEEDRMFDPKDHFYKIVGLQKHNHHFQSWLVSHAHHSRMDKNPEYERKIMNFLRSIDRT